MIEQLCTFAMKMGATTEKATFFAEQIELENRNMQVDVELLYSLIAQKVLDSKKSEPEEDSKSSINQKKAIRTKSKTKDILRPDDMRSICSGGQ